MKLPLISTILTLLSLFVSAGRNKHVCEHSKFKSFVPFQSKINGSSLEGSRLLSTSTSNWSNIRIAVDFTAFDAETGRGIINTTLASEIETTYFPNIVSFLESIIQVQPTSETFTINNSTASCPNVSIPSKYFSASTSVAADFLLLVYTSNVSSSSAMASAVACGIQTTSESAFQASNGRPIVGQIWINAASFSGPSDYLQNVLLHEVTHALVFSPSLWPYFLQNGTRVSSSTQVVQNAVVRGVNTTVIVTPKVVAYAQSYYGCSNITEMELENQGSAGSEGCHWETRTVADELMVAEVDWISYFSGFTAALYEDSGWYQLVDTSQILSSQWGKGKGCGFVDNLCFVNGSTSYSEFCNPYTQTTGCSFDGRWLSVCASYVDPPVSPSIWDYFGNGTLSNDTFCDNCPDWDAALDCRSTGNVATAAVQVYGTSSRCFTGAWGTISNKLPSQITCLESHCYLYPNSTQFILKVVFKNTTLTCPTAGGNVYFSGYSISKYSGSSYLTCQPANQVCVYSCSGCTGLCIDGVCSVDSD